MNTDKTYVLILRDSIANKVHVLESLIELTKKQGKLARSGITDVREFDKILEEKGRQIDMLNMLDDGFTGIYDKVKEELAINTEEYKEELLQIRELINTTTSLGTKLEGLEYENKMYIEAFFAGKKSEVKKFKKSKNMSESYAKNMVNKHLEQSSYFVDKKK